MVLWSRFHSVPVVLESAVIMTDMGLEESGMASSYDSCFVIVKLRVTEQENELVSAVPWYNHV